jgi:hypothetical protein
MEMTVLEVEIHYPHYVHQKKNLVKFQLWFVGELSAASSFDCDLFFSSVLTPFSRLFPFLRAYRLLVQSTFLGRTYGFSTFKEGQSCQMVSVFASYIYLPCLPLYSAAQGRKAEALQLLYANNPSLQVVEIAGIVLQDALVGVDAVIHTALPLPG